VPKVGTYLGSFSLRDPDFDEKLVDALRPTDDGDIRGARCCCFGPFKLQASSNHPTKEGE
jgi:hypothetical protein